VGDYRFINQFLDILGPVTGCHILDAACGEGYLTRKLVDLGAEAVGIDVSESLIEFAKQKSPLTSFDVCDLNDPLPQKYRGKFNVVTSNMALMDVHNYEGFVSAVVDALVPQGRLLLSLHNPYSSVFYDRVSHYFDENATRVYEGLAKDAKTHVTYRHRTLETYVTAFTQRGCLLRTLCDCGEMAGTESAKSVDRLPKIMILEFLKIEEQG
jgi:2-polyprenyl-3-methyl-5-hydroxy-6-metoxy-1,4-benzoquinol methylase